MKKIFIILSCLFVTTCSNGIKEIKSISELEVPEWYLIDEENDEYIFGHGHGADSNKQIAFEKAKSFAINDLSQKIELKAVNKTSNISLANNDQSSSETKIEIEVQSNNILKNYEVVNKGLFIQNSIYHYYLILKYPKSKI